MRCLDEKSCELLVTRDLGSSQQIRQEEGISSDRIKRGWAKVNTDCLGDNKVLQRAVSSNTNNANVQFRPWSKTVDEFLRIA